MKHDFVYYINVTRIEQILFTMIDDIYQNQNIKYIKDDTSFIFFKMHLKIIKYSKIILQMWKI